MNPYPTSAQILALTSQWGVNPLYLFAFAAQNARLPNNPGELNTFIAAAQQVANGFAYGLDLVMGYIQERGALPGSATQLLSWAQGEGLYDNNTPPQQVSTPTAGAKYLGAASAATSQAPSSSTPPAVNATPFGIQVPAFLQNPTTDLAAAGLVVGGLWLLGRRRR